MSEPRFYMEHGVIHDRETGKHVVTDGEPPFEDSVEQVCDLLNSLVAERQLTYGGATELRRLRACLQRIVDNRDNKNWRKPEITQEAERALGKFVARYFISEYTDGPAMRYNVIDRQTQEAWRFSNKSEAHRYADRLNWTDDAAPVSHS